MDKKSTEKIQKARKLILEVSEQWMDYGEGEYLKNIAERLEKLIK
jgi:hypothetical protein